MSKSLYERLGGKSAITAIVNDLVDAHACNPVVKARFQNRDLETSKRMAGEFMCMGSGGPDPYTGAGLQKVHAGMNITEHEFVATMDDLAQVLEKHQVGDRERNEIVGIFMQLKSDVLHR